MAGPWEKYAQTPAPGQDGGQAMLPSGPWMKYQMPAADPGPGTEDQTSGAQAALEHFGNSATLGYLPHLQAMASKLTPDPNADVDAKLRAQGFNIQQQSPNYLQERDANMRRLALENQEHPIASGTGKVGGFIADALLPAGAIAKGASLGAKVLQGVKIGAGFGAAANPGDQEGEVDPLQVGQRMRGAALGAVIGGTVPVAASGVEAGAGRFSGYLRDKAALKATRSLGRPTPTQAAQMAASGQDVRLGRELLDQGAIPVLGTPDRIAGRVDALKADAGQAISDLIDKAGDGKTIDAQKLGLDILSSPELVAMRKTPGMESTVSAIERQVETLANNGQMTVKEAQALRQGIDKSINFNKAAPEMRGAQEGLYQQRTAIRNAMNDSINEMNPGGAKDALLNANRKYGNLSTASDILEREVGRNQANRAISLTDTIAGAAGAFHGAPAALLLGGLNKAGRTFGNSIQARGYDAIANKLATLARATGAVNANPMAAQVIAQRASGGLPDQFGPSQSDPQPQSDPRQLGVSPRGAVRAPSGEDRWANQGIEKLGIEDNDLARRLFQDPKAKELLIQASDLAPGSKAMKQIMNQINTRWGTK